MTDPIYLFTKLSQLKVTVARVGQDQSEINM